MTRNLKGKKMTKSWILSLLFVTAIINSGIAEVLFNDQCDYDCNNAIFPAQNVRFYEILFVGVKILENFQGEVDPDRKYVTSCCLRGCRFFNLADISPRSSNYNNSLEACDAGKYF